MKSLNLTGLHVVGAPQLLAPPVVCTALGAAAAWSATVGWGFDLPWFDEQRVAMLVVVSLALVATVSRGFTTTAPLRVPVALLVALAAGLISASLAARPDAALLEWASVSALWLVAVLSGLRADDVPRAAAVVAAIPAAAYVTAVVSNYFSALALGMPVGAETLLVGFANPRFPAQLQALTLPLLPMAWRLFSRPLVRLPLAIAWALWWACLIGSGSRTAWLALALASVAVVLLGAEGRRWLALQASFAVVGGLLYWIGFFAVPDLLGLQSAVETGRFSSTASIEARFELWRLAVDMATSAPLLGVGPMHFAYDFNGLGAHPHNWWLQIGAEWGLVATGGFLFVFVITWWRLLRSVVAERRIGGCSIGKVAVIAAFAVWSVGILLDGYMVVPTSQLLSAAVLMLVFAEAGITRERAVGRSSSCSMTSSLLVGMCVCVVCVIGALPWTSLGNPKQREAAWRTDNPGATLWPRFWTQGWIGPDQDVCVRSPGCGNR